MATPHDAARAGDVPALVSLLAANPLSLNARDRHSRTPYPRNLSGISGVSCLAEAARILCQKNADVGAAAADDMAAIHFASQKGHTEIVRVLLGAGASVNARTRKGMTALHYAIQGSHLEVAKLLIKKGASLDTQTKAGKKPIDLAKDQPFRSAVLAAETERREAKLSQAIDKKAKSPGKNLAPSSKQNDKEECEDGNKESDTSPPRKKSKVQLSHLATEQESGLENEENG